jgi:GT2 family glycosyltransferase
LELSVIILNYKVPAHLLLCVDSVSKAIENIDAEIIVADNHSQDKSLSLLAQFFPEVKQIPIQENLGFSKGNNIAVQQAKGKYICLLNPDTVLAENTFQQALAYANQKSRLGALGIQLVDGKGMFLPESKRNIPTLNVAVKKLLGSGKLYYANHLNENDIGEVSILVGAFMLMQKNRYLEVGGLDEDYFMYGEDIDLSYQFLKKKYINYYLGSVSCLHFKGESTVKDIKFRKRFFGAMQLFYTKHFRSNMLMLYIVNFGLKIAQFFSIGVASEKTKKVDVNCNFLVSNNQKLLETLQENESLKMISKKELLQLEKDSAKLIFDAAYLEYSEIIQQIKKLSTSRFNFRIIPRIHNLYLGSDGSRQAAEVKYFTLKK